MFKGSISSQSIIEFLAYVCAAALIISAHEFAHAFAAVKNGDITPKIYKRYTLNPIAHFDPLGILMLAVVGFGWAKPVPVNPSNFRNYRKGLFWVSIAGVLTNYVLAFLVFPVFVLAVKFMPDFLLFDEFIFYFLIAMYNLNLVFCVFNLLPLYPLDGFRVLEAVSKKHGKVYMFLRNYGYYILLGFVILGFLVRSMGLNQFDFLSIFLKFIVNKAGYPIFKFWSLLGIF